MHSAEGEHIVQALMLQNNRSVGASFTYVLCSFLTKTTSPANSILVVDDSPGCSRISCLSGIGC